jgi:hypothetical protein
MPHLMRAWFCALIVSLACANAFAQASIQQFHTRNCADCPSPRPKFSTHTEACEDLARVVQQRLGSSNQCGPIQVNQHTCSRAVGDSWDWGVLAIDIRTNGPIGCAPAGGLYGFVVQSSTIAALYQVSLEGDSRTRALPAGPTLKQAAIVTQGGTRVAGKAVTITTGEGGTIGGVTDGAGRFEFKYVPPMQRPLIDVLSATCTDCQNIATKQVVVEHCDACGGGAQ